MINYCSLLFYHEPKRGRQSCFLKQLWRQKTHTSTWQTVACVLLCCLSSPTVQQSLTLMLSLSSPHTRFLTPWPPEVTHYHTSVCVCVCVWLWVCVTATGRDCLSTSQTETSGVNGLCWRPSSGLRGELAISHLSFTVLLPTVCNHAMVEWYEEN